jgi:hypothetical protein
MNRKALLILVVFCLGCSSEIKRVPAPKNLIPEDTMVMVLTDLSILEAHIKNKYPLLVQNYKVMKASGDLILQQHHIDSTRLDQALDYYGSRQKKMQEINSKVLEVVNRKLTELSAQ